MKFLYPLSLIYSTLYKADRKFKNPKRLLKPVISVGNITWGGTGKTPVVIELLNFLINNNLKPAVLTRGYSRKSKIPLFLKDGANDIDALESGDEPLLIAKSVPRAWVIVGANRYKNVVKFKDRMNPDVYVLDDGFQHWSIKRELDIVCINAVNPFGNGMLIPAGVLREKPKSLERAGLIIITNSDMVLNKELVELETTIFALSGRKPVATYYSGFEYKTVDLNTNFNINFLKKFDVYSLSAIGFAMGFKNSIEKSGIKVKDNIVLRDHSSYADFKKIINQKSENAYFIITAKDAVKFQNSNEIDTNIKKKVAVLVVKLRFLKGREQWERELLKCLRSF
jgi:tetraacyldisaccharide 4'-kinase